MKLRFINVGYGESTLLTAERPDGTPFYMLIDGGSGEAEEYAGQPQRVRAAAQIKALGIRRLDVLFNTHIHEDHTCGLPAVAEQCEIGEYWCCVLPDGNEDWPELSPEIITLPCSDKCLRALNDHRKLLQRFRAGGVPVRMLRQDSGISLPVEGLTARIIGPTREETDQMNLLLEKLYAETDRDTQKHRLLDVDRMMNNHSAMLLLDYYGTRILLPGDTNCLGYGHLPRQTLKADIFKVGHHGQRDGADEALVKAVSPRMLVVCASSDRRYNSMHPEILSLFRENDPSFHYLLSDTPDLPPWSDGIPVHSASELTIGNDGSIALAYLTE